MSNALKDYAYYIGFAHIYENTSSYLNIEKYGINVVTFYSKGKRNADNVKHFMEKIKDGSLPRIIV